MPFWDILQQAPSSPSALPSGAAGTRPFWEQLGSKAATQTNPGDDLAESMEAPDAPTNPLAYVAGMAKNLVLDVPEVLRGLTTLGGKVVEDVVGGAQMLIPGTQGTERKIQEQGFNTANMVRSMDDALAADYGNRYGMAGPHEMLDQLYSNPLTYVMDALMVGGAASAGAKAGYKAGIVSEGLATKIRGVSPLAESVGALRPANPLMNLQGGAAAGEGLTAFGTQAGQVMPGLVTLGTSFNPAKRFIQNTIINRLLTRSGEQVLDLAQGGQWQRLGISPDNLGLQAQVLERANQAVASGMRILKPQPEKFLAHRAARMIAGLSKQEFYGTRNLMVAELRHAMGLSPNEKGEANWAQVQELMGTGRAFQARLNGTMTSLTPYPVQTPVFLDHGIPVLGELDVPVVGINPEGRLKVLEAVQSHFRNATGGAGGDTVAIQAFNTPHSRLIDGQTGAMRFSGLVGDINQATPEAMRIAERNGWRLMGVRDYLAEPGQAWNGLHYYFETPDGVAEINIATPELMDAQKLVSKINELVPGSGVIDSLEMEQANIMRELGVVEDLDNLAPEDAAKVERLTEIDNMIPKIRDELDAATVRAQAIWRHPMRHLNDPEYDPGQATIDRLHNWTVKWNLLPMAQKWGSDWIADSNAIGPFATDMNRSFMPMKLEVMHHLLTDAKTEVAKIIQEGHQNKLSVDEVLDDVAALFALRYPMFPIEEVRKAMFTWADEDVADAFYRANMSGEDLGERATARIAERVEHPDAPASEAYRAGTRIDLKDPEASAMKLLDRIGASIKMPLLRGASQGLPEELIDAWSWKSFVDVVPDIPAYYPHIRSNSGASMWWKGTVPTRAPQMRFNKGFKGYLQESGRILDNPFEAYGRRAYQLLRHEELTDQLEKLKGMGRLLSRTEVMEIQSNAAKLNGEVLFSPDYLTSKVRLHAEILDEIWRGVSDDGLLYEDAARNAIQMLNEKLQATTTADLVNAKVYAIPKYVADQFTSGFLQGFAPSRMRFFWDKPRDLWMSSTLGLNPRWFIYRMMGNIIFTGVSHPSSIPRLFGWARSKNNELIEVIMADTATANGQLLKRFSQGYAAAESQRIGLIAGRGKKLGLPPGSGEKFREWGSAADEFPEATRRLDMIYNSRWASVPKKISRSITQAVNVMEQAERRGIAIGVYAKQVGRQLDSNIALARKMALEGVDESDVKQMIESSNWTLGNYTNLSPLERDVIRRFFMPFYPFYRHMIKFALRMPWDHPMKSQTLRLLAEVDEDMGPHLPDYLGGSVYLGEMGGMPTYWNITRWNPLAELTLPEFNPAMGLDFRLRSAWQALSGTDEFGRPYEASNVYEAPNGVKLIRTESGWEVFEGIEHPPWTDLVAEWYGGPGSNLVRGLVTQDKFNMPATKAIAGNLGVTLSQYDQVGAMLRELEAMQAAMGSQSAAQVPVSR